MAASEAKLNEVHNLLADTLIARLKGVERESTEFDEDGEGTTVKTLVLASAAELAVAAKFLKDNSVTMQPGEGNKLGELQDQLRAKRQFNKRDLTEAMKQIGSGLVQ